MPGILVTGDNHFIVRGPKPDPATALSLARHWSHYEVNRYLSFPPERQVIYHFAVGYPVFDARVNA